MFRGRIGTIGLKQAENQMKPNKCDFCTLLIMLYFCTENERNLFSIENRPVGFYTECLLILRKYHREWLWSHYGLEKAFLLAYVADTLHRLYRQWFRRCLGRLPRRLHLYKCDRFLLGESTGGNCMV